MEELKVYHFETPEPLSSLPRLINVGMEQREDTTYRHEGQYRQSELHFLFKYTLSGEGAFRDGNGEHRIPRGTGFLCEIRDPHTAYYYPDDATAPWRFIFICFKGGNTRRIVHEMLQRFGPLYTLPPETPILQEFMALGRRDPKPQTISPIAGAEQVMRLLFRLAESHRSHNAPTTAYRLLQRAQHLIRKNIARPMNVTQLAEELGVTREYLTRVFRQQLGVSPYRYLLRRKMRRAAELLKDTDLTLKQIAPRVGVENASRFARTFKQVMLLNPGEFRRVGVLPME